LRLQLPLPLVEGWEELQARLGQLAGEVGLKILHGILEEEVRQRVGPRHRPDPALGAVRVPLPLNCVDALPFWVVKGGAGSL
jgi:hypothetical protein